MEQAAYMELIDFIATGCTPKQIVDFRPSETTQRRVAHLLEKLKAETITSDEAAELDHYMELEKLFALAKARARRHLIPQARLSTSAGSNLPAHMPHTRAAVASSSFNAPGGEMLER